MAAVLSSKGIALVTGAAQGIGRAIAMRLADDGYHVAVNDIRSNQEGLHTLAKEIVAKGRLGMTITADVSAEEQVENMVEKVVNDLGGLDVMVANAGVLKVGSITETTAKDWDHQFAVNVRGTFLCFKYAAKQMLVQGRGGRILGASSLAGKQGEPMLSGYCSTKFAIRGLTQSAARELGKHGITVNSYAPGAISTTMLQAIDDGFTTKLGMKSGAFLESMDNRAAVGHKGTPREIASLVSYLVSKEAHFITGQSIMCDGGVYFD